MANDREQAAPKHHLLRWLMLLALCAGAVFVLSTTAVSGQTKIGSILTPEGYERTNVSSNFFGTYLRSIELKADARTVFLYNGEPKHPQMSTTPFLTSMWEHVIFNNVQMQ